MDGLAYLNVYNNSNYSYKVDLITSSSHAYCPTCSTDRIPGSGCNDGDAACPETNTPNPRSYGGSDGSSGAIAPCGDDVLAPGDNFLQYSPYHHCCDITKDVLFAAYLVITEYRYLGEPDWQLFPAPLPAVQGWASNEHVAEVGFTFGDEIDAGGDPNTFTIPSVTTSACLSGGSNEHYAESAADFDGDGIPDACDCDDDNDGCLDGYDITSGQDTRKDCCTAPLNCDTGDTTITTCQGNLSLFGRYDNYPYSCRGYSSVPAGCVPGTCPTCTPTCAGKECGDDGCEGTCGTCPAGESCDNGVCDGTCQPDCADKECGPDGCDGECGMCAPGQFCSHGTCMTF
jgi:hypothetical protein